MKNVDLEILKKDMRFSTLDGFFFALMAGAGEGYFVAFALELGLDPVSAGLLGTLPLFIGGILQLFVQPFLRRSGKYHRFVFIASILQACSFIPLVYCAWFKLASFPLFLMINSAYWILAFAIGPAWSVLMSGIIPMEVRVKFFSKRSVYTYSGMFLGVFASGIMLEIARRHNHTIDFFALVFLFCFVVRLISSSFLKKHSTVPPEKKPKTRWTITQMMNLGSDKTIAKIILFIVVFKIGVFVSAPFFVPYMLKELELNYVSFVVLISSSILGKILISRKLPQLVGIFSLQKLLFLACFGISLVPIAWLFSNNIIFLLFIQIVSGIAWGSFDYSFFLIIFNQVPRDDQARYLSAFNFYNAIAIISGSLIGSFIFLTWSLLGSHYAMVFTLSTCIRMVSLILFPHFFQKFPIGTTLISRVMSFRPNQGTIDRPIIATNEES